MMKISSSCSTCLTIIIVISGLITMIRGQPLVPALFFFGDSIVDVGNNNFIKTIVKSDFPPYGRDYVAHEATGRFSNGKLSIDYTAENLGFTTYPLPYLSKEADGKNLLIGANFASGGSGYYESTAKLYHTIPLSKQVEYYKEYQAKIYLIAGISNASSIISSSVYFVSGGSSDFLQNYYLNPVLYKVYSPDEFSDMLIESFIEFVHQIYDLGARKIGVTSLPPLGCLPAAITLFGDDSNECVSKLNRASVYFNDRLNATTIHLQNQLTNLTLVILDIYQPLYDLVMKPEDFGFVEARKACCGTGVVELSILCNSKSVGTCANATQYVFWDGVHPSEAANKLLSDDLLAAGIALVL